MRNRWPWLWRFLCRLCTASGASRQRHLYVGAQDDDQGELRRNMGAHGMKVGGFGSRRNSSRLEHRPRRRRLRWWRLLYNRWRKAEDGGERRKPFVWREHPSMIKQAVEGGCFAFRFVLSHYNSRSGEDEPPKIWWEMLEDEEEQEQEEERGCKVVVQKLYLNPGLAAAEDQVGFVQALRLSLPLPGPPDLFPSQAYFEITILSYDDDHHQRSSLQNEEVHPLMFPCAFGTSAVHDVDGLQSEGSKKKKKQPRGIMSSDPSSSTSSRVHASSTTAPLKAFNAIACDAALKEEEEEENAVQQLENSKILAIGLVGDVESTRNSRLRRSEEVLDLFPGDTIGSAGWRSDGSIFVSGMCMNTNPNLQCRPQSHRHPAEPSHDTDGTENATVGCGFDPASRTVFFTLNGNLMYRTGTMGREFGYPLYPAVAANYAVCLRPNFGQTPFLYLQANHVSRILPNFRKPKFGFVMEDEEDSGELFSLPRRIGSMRWHSDRHPPPSDVESDRFDIVLDI